MPITGGATSIGSLAKGVEGYATGSCWCLSKQSLSAAENPAQKIDSSRTKRMGIIIHLRSKKHRYIWYAE